MVNLFIVNETGKYESECRHYTGVTHDVGKVLREILSGLKGLLDAETLYSTRASKHGEHTHTRIIFLTKCCLPKNIVIPRGTENSNEY